MRKVFSDADAALQDVLFDGMTIVAGGFGLCGIPETLIGAVQRSGVKNITVISNNAGVDDFGLGLLLKTRQIRKMVASYVGENMEFNPQGTLAERMRAGGAGIPGFYTRTGVGTQIAEGKEMRQFGNEDYLLETGLSADLAIVKAWKGDPFGNLVYRKSARNFNPMAATCARVTVAEVEQLVGAGSLDPDLVHTSSIYVTRLIHARSNQKRIEQRRTRAGAP